MSVIQPEPQNLTHEARQFLAEAEEAYGPLDLLTGSVHVTITASTTETPILPASALRQNPYVILLTNSGVTATIVTIRDKLAGTGANNRMVLAVPAADTRGFSTTPDGAMMQSAAGQAWTAQCSAATTSLEVHFLFTQLR